MKDFFDKHLSILQKNGEANGNCYLDLAFDQDKESYFTIPANPKYLYLDNIPFESPKELEKYLNNFWKNQPGLLKLIPDLIQLAFNLKAEQKEQSAELSPFVYTMF